MLRTRWLTFRSVKLLASDILRLFFPPSSRLSRFRACGRLDNGSDGHGLYAYPAKYQLHAPVHLGAGSHCLSRLLGGDWPARAASCALAHHFCGGMAIPHVREIYSSSIWRSSPQPACVLLSLERIALIRTVGRVFKASILLP